MPQDLSAVAWPLRTARLTLRPATTDDVAATWRIRRQPEVGRWITRAPTDVAATWRIRRQPEVGRWITRAPTDVVAYAEAFRDPERLSLTLVYELDGTVVGDLMLRIEDAWAQVEVAEDARAVQAELGWTLDPALGGHGYATEAVAELVRLCFEELGLRRVVASCFADNTASWRLMERLGMRREQVTVRESLHRELGWVDGLGYALLADEWRVRRAGRG